MASSLILWHSKKLVIVALENIEKNNFNTHLKHYGTTTHDPSHGMLVLVHAPCIKTVTDTINFNAASQAYRERWHKARLPLFTFRVSSHSAMSLELHSCREQSIFMSRTNEMLGVVRQSEWCLQIVNPLLSPSAFPCCRCYSYQHL